MRRVTLGLGLAAIIALSLAATAQAAVSTESTYGVTTSGSAAGGTKKAPAPWSGSWTLTAVNNVNPAYRTATPASWSWSWKGVKVNQTGVPTCTTDQINDAKSAAVCPAGSHIGIGPIPGAMFGGVGAAEGPNTFCGGKTFDLYNGKPGEFSLAIDGPPEQCGTLGFTGASPVTLATSGGRTTMTWQVPDNIAHPLPGVEATLLGGTFVFNNLKGSAKSATAAKKGKKKKKKSYLFTSVNCKGPRDFQFTIVDPFGTHQLSATAGNCKAPKKGKKKKKK
jgi:hypothetical protein